MGLRGSDGREGSLNIQEAFPAGSLRTQRAWEGPHPPAEALCSDFWNILPEWNLVFLTFFR